MMWGGKGVFLSAFPMRLSCAIVNCRCATGERDVVRDVPKYPPGRGSSWVREPMGRPEACAKSVVPGPFVEDGLELVDVGCDLTFTHV